MSDEEYFYSEDEEANLEEDEQGADLNSVSASARSSSTPRNTHAVIVKDRDKTSSEAFRVLDSRTIQQQQEKLILYMQDVLSTTTEETQRMLMEYRWNKEALMDEYLKLGLDTLRRKAGVHAGDAAPTEATCLTCFDNMTVENSLENSFCHHRFCIDCWGGHILIKVRDGGSRRIPCMQDKCRAVVDHEIVSFILAKHPLELQRYDRAMIDSFIEDNPRVKWCPSVPCCGRAIEVSESSSLRVDCECVCEEIFCFSCYDTTHTPVPCEWAKAWRDKCLKESANAIFIAANCKACPKCKKPIQKGDGCNHVTCVCGQCMCWLCGAATGRAHDMNSIVGHTCERYRVDVASAAKQQLDTYVHYYDKYHIHMQSLQKAKDVEATVNQTIDKLNDVSSSSPTRLSLQETDWLWIGLKQLFRMRRFIAWTYVFAFYAFFEENGQRIKEFESKISNAGAFYLQTIFEDLQSQLQNAIENLSKLVEMDAKNMDHSTKAAVLQLSNGTHQAAMNLWKYAAEDILVRALRFYAPPNMYFPIRRIVSGLGAKGIVETADITDRNTASANLAVNLTTVRMDVVDLTQDSPERDKQKKKKNKSG